MLCPNPFETTAYDDSRTFAREALPADQPAKPKTQRPDTRLCVAVNWGRLR